MRVISSSLRDLLVILDTPFCSEKRSANELSAIG